MEYFRRKKIASVLRDDKIPYSIWAEVTSRLPLIRRLSAEKRTKIRVLSSQLLQDKVITGASGLKLTSEMLVAIAAQACLPILQLGLAAYDGWMQIIIYPDAFRVDHDTTDEHGIVHQQASNLSGEAWQDGPLILSWRDVQRDSFEPTPGRNVVIHEFAHKLDMLNGRANGMPPLLSNMPIHEWTHALGEAYETLLQQRTHDACLNPYAATNPAEFFAVACEYFFTAPEVLRHGCPAVFEQLQQYFRQ